VGSYADYLALVLSIATVITTVPQPFDWPQWRGPNRDGISRETGLNLDWTEKKPPLLWSFKQAGAGYSSPTIIGTTLYCAGATEGNDFAFALGYRDWQTQMEAAARKAVRAGSWRRATYDDHFLS
jgi:hypothetical protein